MKQAVRALGFATLLMSGVAMAQQDMTESIAEQLMGIGGPMILCVLEGDTVTLFGNVEDRLEGQRIISQVRDIEGVEEVIDRLNTQ